MIPATTSVKAFDPVTGVEQTFDQWVPSQVSISAPDDETDAEFTPTSAHVTLTRCRTLPGGKTQRLPDFAARRLGVERTLTIFVQNIYADATDTGPAFSAKPYPEGASETTRLQIDLENAQARQQHAASAKAYPAAVKAAILAAPAEPKSLMELVVRAAATLGTAQGKL